LIDVALPATCVVVSRLVFAFVRWESTAQRRAEIEIDLVDAMYLVESYFISSDRKDEL